MKIVTKETKLVNMLKTAKDGVIDTPDYLRNTCLNGLIKKCKISNALGYLYVNGTPENTEKVYIGGYYDLNNKQGVLDSQKVSHSSYTLHLFATKANTNIGFLVDLSQLLGECSISKGSDDLGKLRRYLLENEDYFALRDMMGRKTIESELFGGPVCIKDAINNCYPVYAAGIITNIHKKSQLSYDGDISLRLDRNIGEGYNFLDKGIKKDTELLNTNDALFGTSPAGEAFRTEIKNNMRAMSEFVDASGVKFDSKNWLLLGDNSKYNKQ